MNTRSYEEYRVLTAGPIARVRLLYDKVISETEAARECLRQNDPMGRGRHVSKAFDVVTELLLSLKEEVAPELTANLKQLYEYIHWRLAIGHAQRSDAALEEVQVLMRELREGWVDPAQPASAPESAEAPQATVRACPAPRPSNPYMRVGDKRPASYL